MHCTWAVISSVLLVPAAGQDSCDWGQESGGYLCGHSSWLSSTTGVMPCWPESEVKEGKRCCAAGIVHDRPGWKPSDSELWEPCFDEMFTMPECCGRGYVFLEPMAGLPARTTLPLGPRASSSPLAASHEQLNWERDMAPASVLSTCTVQLPAPSTRKVSITIRSFKSDTFALLGAVYNHTDASAGEWVCKLLQKDEYGFLAGAGALDRWQGDKGHIFKHGETYVDIGANVGWWAVLMAKIYEPIGLRVVAVEPNRGAHRYLLWNLRVNGVASRVIAVHAGLVGVQPGAPRALWMERCTPLGNYSACFSWSSRLRGRGQLQHGLSDLVPTVSFPTLLRRLNISSVAVLKVDCEGCEWPLFGGGVRGDAGWLAMRPLVRHVVGEAHDFDSHEPVPGASHPATCLFWGSDDLERVLRNRSLVRHCQGPQTQ